MANGSGVAEFRDLRIFVANGVVGRHSPGDPLVVIIWFLFLGLEVALLSK